MTPATMAEIAPHRSSGESSPVSERTENTNPPRQGFLPGLTILEPVDDSAPILKSGALQS
jgi:hypothetical protein